MSDDSFLRAETITTYVAGLRFHAVGPPEPGMLVQLVREPDNPADPNAIAVRDTTGRRIGYLPREIAEQYAGLIDHGLVRLQGQLAAAAEPAFDPDRFDTNPVLYLSIYASPTRLAEFRARADADSTPIGRPAQKPFLRED